MHLFFGSEEVVNRIINFISTCIPTKNIMSFAHSLTVNISPTDFYYKKLRERVDLKNNKEYCFKIKQGQRGNRICCLASEKRTMVPCWEKTVILFVVKIDFIDLLNVLLLNESAKNDIIEIFSTTYRNVFTSSIKLSSRNTLVLLY